MNEQHYKIFYVLDLDRTLFDTLRNARLLSEVVDAYDPRLGSVLNAHLNEWRQERLSFSMYEFIRDRAGEEAVIEVKRRYLERAQSETLLLPGAHELMEFIGSRKAGVGILTYGSPDGQRMKLEATELASVPAIVTDVTAKGALIASWRRGERFLLPSPFDAVSDEIVLVDDRLTSFEGLPTDQARGYWISANSAESMADLPANITPVVSLAAVIHAEQAFDKSTSAMR